MSKKVLIFDWDGVIVNSNAFKWEEAWSVVFKDEPERKKKIESILASPGGLSINRYELLRRTFAEEDERYEKMNPQEVLKDKTILSYAQKFSEVTKNGIVNIGLFPHVREALGELKEKKYKMYIISSTKEEDLAYMARELDVERYFEGIFGLPNGKKENAERINGLDARKCLMIGDGSSDMKLAQTLNCPFIGISNKWNKWDDETVDIDICLEADSHMETLPDAVKKIFN